MQVARPASRRACSTALGWPYDVGLALDPYYAQVISMGLPHREARDDSETLRQRLREAEDRGQQLQRENAALRRRLGEESAEQLALEPAPAPEPGTSAEAATPAPHSEMRAPGSAAAAAAGGQFAGDSLGAHSNASTKGSADASVSVSAAEDEDEESAAAGLLGVHGEGTADVGSSGTAARVGKQAPAGRPFDEDEEAAAAGVLGVHGEGTADLGSRGTAVRVEKQAPLGRRSGGHSGKEPTQSVHATLGSADRPADSNDGLPYPY